MERQAGVGALANCKGAYVRETPGPEVRATHKGWRSAIRLSAVFVAWSLAACSHAVDIPATTLLPVVPGDEASRSVPFIAWYQDLSKSGYVEEEYLVSGDANLYEYVDEDVQSSAVRVGDEAIPYVSRLLIRRPVDAERFNGTLYLEVLNPSAGWDGDPIWQNTHEYLMRAGAIYAGLTSKPVALDFLRDKWGRDPFPVRNGSRYAQLEMPYFGQIWDMLSEVAALLKSPGRDGNPLAGFPVRRTVLTGYSQSVAYQVTYANSFHARARMPDGAPLIDGYYLAAGGGAKNVNRPTPETESLPPGDRRNLVDVDVPVVRFQTETEVPRSYRLRQHPPEYPWVRIYEMAGGAHVDRATVEIGGKALAGDLGLPGFAAGCDERINPISIGFVQSAMLEIIDQWVRGAAEPPPSRVIDMVDGAGGSRQIARDASGNALGGVRPPSLDVPLGRYLPNNTGAGFCFLIGSFAPFKEAELTRRYPDHNRYVQEVADAASRATAARFLLEPDADRLRAEAMRSGIGK